MDCFISYATPDVEIAHALKNRLIRCGLTVFLAQDSIPPGSHWRTMIPSIVKRSEVLLLLDSIHSRESVWVQQEAGMAHASGSLLIPISIDGQLNKLPGWLADIEAIKLDASAPLDASVDHVVTEVCTRLGASLDRLPIELKRPKTVADAVLNTILMDQFLGPPERAGAWSRHYDRYLHLYYGDAPIHHAVSQSATLTFTGMTIERLAKFKSARSSHVLPLVNEAIRQSEAFILASQDSLQGGFGRLSSDHRARGGRALQLDLRHTCWAIRALSAIDNQRFAQQINDGLHWLASRAKVRNEEDRWCWSAAPLLAMLMNSQLLDNIEWHDTSNQIRLSVQADLENGFDRSLRSWVKGENAEMRRSACIDNALYVLYCLKDVHGLSTRLLAQATTAIDGIIAQSLGSLESRGIPLFGNEPEVGPTAQLLEILHNRPLFECSQLENFVVHKLAARHMMPQTFSWHLSAALALPDLRDRPIPHSPHSES